MKHEATPVQSSLTGCCCLQQWSFQLLEASSVYVEGSLVIVRITKGKGKKKKNNKAKAFYLNKKHVLRIKVVLLLLFSDDTMPLLKAKSDFALIY